MSIIPYRKTQSSDLANLHRDMDDLFNSFFGNWPATYDAKVWPAMDVSETENEYLVTAEVPGCKAEDIDISVHGNSVTISGEKKNETEQKEKGYYHIERSYGSFRRELSLPVDIKNESIDAQCKDGVLKITLPKAEKAKAMKVKVKAE